MLHHCNMRTFQFFLSTNSSVIFRIIPVTNETSLSGISEKDDNLMRGASHSNKKTGTFEKVANGTESSRKSFGKIVKLVNFLNQSAHNYKYQMERQFQMRNLRYSFGYSLRGCSLYRTSWKMLFLSQLQMSGNCLYRKRTLFFA